MKLAFYIIIIPLLIFFKQAKAQEDNSPSYKIGVTGSIDISYRYLTTRFDALDYTKITVFDRNLEEIPKIGSTTGLSFIYTPGKFGIEAAALYSRKGEQIFSGDDWYRSSYNYLDVPLKLIYNFPIAKKKILYCCRPFVQFLFRS